ncbi:MAG: nicotinate-nucleotide--dimethylbenzimidazole phosphoribosyltransferase [Caldilinea sp.]
MSRRGTGQLLSQTVAQIGALDPVSQLAARQRQQELTKPAGALGRLEALSVQLAGITGSLCPPLRPCRVIVCAADHGVAAAGVSAYPASVTAQMVHNFLAGGAAVNVLARLLGAEVTVVDVGVAAALPAHPHLVAAKIRAGTRNFLEAPALTPDEAVAAVETGIQVARAAVEQGTCLLVTGEMGIGNTTASAAIAAVLTGRAPAAVTGRGTGIDEVRWQHKVAVIEEALARHRPERNDPIDVLSKIGGLEIGAIAGVVLAAAAARVPVLVDGLISTAGAALAFGLCPAAQPFAIAGHESQEPGHRALLDCTGLSPLLNLSMRLGEGSGALLALPLLDAARATLNEMATFEGARVAGPLDVSGLESGRG